MAGGKSSRTTIVPRWVRISLWLAGAVIVLFVVMLASGHGPGQHPGGMH